MRHLRHASLPDRVILISRRSAVRGSWETCIPTERNIGAMRLSWSDRTLGVVIPAIGPITLSNSWAVPRHGCVATNAFAEEARTSCSRMTSIAFWRLAVYACSNLSSPQATLQVAKSANRGGLTSRVSGSCLTPVANISHNAPKMPGRCRSNSAHNARSVLRFDSGASAKVMARSRRSGRVAKLAMPSSAIGRAPANSASSLFVNNARVRIPAPVLRRAKLSDTKSGSREMFSYAKKWELWAAMNKSATASRQRSARDSVWIDQGPQGANEVSLGRALLPVNCDNRIRATWLQGSKQESDNEDEVVLADIRKKWP